MNVDAFTSIIQTVGFPIVCCAAMFWLINKITDRHSADNEKMTEAINNNTIVLTKILTKLGDYNDSDLE